MKTRIIQVVEMQMPTLAEPEGWIVCRRADNGEDVLLTFTGQAQAARMVSKFGLDDVGRTGTLVVNSGEAELILV